MQFTIASRFCGPRNSGNGGYTSGVIAQALGGEAEVTLRAPPPLETPLEIQVGGDNARMVIDTQLLVEAQRTKVDLEVPAPPTWAEALAAQRSFAGLGHHEYPFCFTCGTSRRPGDGLCVH